MTERCEDLDQFFDRELGAEAAQEFRDHLATCTRCQEVLLGRMLEAEVVAGEAAPPRTELVPPPVAPREPEAPLPGSAAPAPPAPAAPAPEPPGAPTPAPGAPVPEPAAAAEPVAVTLTAVPGAPLVEPPTDDRPGPRSWPTIAACAGVLAAAAAVVVLLPAPPRAPALTLAPTRTVEVRFSAAALDHHRPLGVMRAAGDPATEQIKLQELTDLERAGARNELVGALAMNGDLASARRNARNLPVSAQSLIDRAALELLEIDHAAPVAELAQDPAATRALSLTADALRIAPDAAQAKWNQAVALRRIGLALTAAAAFDDVAALREPGWAQEARANADSLRRGYQGEIDDWKQIAQDADRMVLGGPALPDRAVARAPSLARDKLYLAVATAATTARLDALVPLARALDQQFATTALGDLIAHVRASDLAARAPLAAELHDFLALHKPVEGIGELRARALKRGLTDVALASFLAVPENDTDEDDAASLDRLAAGHRDEWWHLIALSLRAYVAEFWRRDYPAVDAIARLAEPLCRTVRTIRCARILVYAGGANSQMGRGDLASEQLTTALHQARAAAAPEHELAALDALGQAIAIRVTDDVDASAVAGAYLDEVALRRASCDTRLHRLDFAATSALQRHRYVQAAAARRSADALEQGECRDARLRLNGETARLQLVLRGRDSVDTLRGKLARLEAGNQPHQRLYLDYLGAAATLVEDRARGEAELRRVITAADARPDATYAALVRASAFDALVESAAAAGSASIVLALLSERLGAPRFERCVLGVASWSHLVVAAFDAGGKSVLDAPRDVPEGAVMIPAAKVVSPAMRARLASCPRIDVVAPGPYLGAPRLLGDDVAWVYHTGQAGRTGRTGRTGAPPPRDPAHRREVVVSQVTPPESLRLPSLQAFAPGDGAELLSGARATPTGVLAAIRTASLVVIVAHGFTDASEPSAASLILSPDAQGDYLLTAAKVRSATLTGSPVVILAGCDAGRVQVSAEPWSLATSFLAAGARVVIAPTEPIPDAGAGEVFRSLVERIRGGADPVEAINVERRSRGAAAAWLSSIVVFE